MCGVAGHVAPEVRKEREGGGEGVAGAQLTGSVGFLQSRTVAQGVGLPRYGVVHPMSVKSILKSPHGQAQVFVTQMILDPVKIKINCHT